MLQTHSVFFLPQLWNLPLLQRNPLAFIREWPLETKMWIMSVLMYTQGIIFFLFLLICNVFSEHEKLGPYYLRCSHLFCSTLVEDKEVSELIAHISEKQIYWLKYSISSQFENPYLLFCKLNQYLNCDHCSSILAFIFFSMGGKLAKSGSHTN